MDKNKYNTIQQVVLPKIFMAAKNVLFLKQDRFTFGV
jgi:hypothetical protein